MSRTGSSERSIEPSVSATVRNTRFLLLQTKMTTRSRRKRANSAPTLLATSAALRKMLVSDVPSASRPSRNAATIAAALAAPRGPTRTLGGKLLELLEHARLDLAGRGDEVVLRGEARAAE
jgi:hypothetical protein